VDHNNVGVCEPRVVFLVFVVPVTELRSGDSVGEFHEELDEERTVLSVVILIDAEPEFACEICKKCNGV